MAEQKWDAATVSAALGTYLHRAKITEVVKIPTHVVTALESNTIAHTVQALRDAGVSSCPVVDNAGQCVAIVDMLDIVLHILTVAPGSLPASLKKVLDPWSVQLNEVRDLRIAGREMADEHIGVVAGCSKRNPLVRLHSNSSLFHVVDYLSLEVHRAPVVDENNKVVGMISQSDVVRVLNDVLVQPDLAGLAHKTVQELGWVGPVCSVRLSDQVLTALKELHESEVSGLPVLGDDGVLCGTFSAANVRALFSEQLPSLFRPVGEFLRAHQPASLHCITVRANSTLLDVVRLMSAARIHRVWVVGPDFHVIGVVSMSDVMKKIRLHVLE